MAHTWQDLIEANEWKQQEQSVPSVNQPLNSQNIDEHIKSLIQETKNLKEQLNYT